ncbi:hypothetical protein AZH11_13160 [Pseudomonas simiae]|nr:hypothetical protein AZH11_13160 [Pseudomonas simiae]
MLTSSTRSGFFSLFIAPSVMLGATWLSGCTTPYDPPQFHAPPGESTEFAGIATMLQSAPEKTLDVLIVHGMCTQDAQWAAESIRDLNTMLGGKDPVAPKRTDVPGTRVQLYQQNLAIAGGHVRANALAWWPVIAPLKEQLCYDQSNKSQVCVDSGNSTPAYPYQRASINKVLKDEMIDDCLADALIYQGKSRDFISGQIQTAILRALATPGGEGTATQQVQRVATEQTPLVILAESLGSKVVFDALNGLLSNADDAKGQAARQTFMRTRTVFMMANQLPLLGLADQNLQTGINALDTDDRYPQDPIRAMVIKLGDAASPQSPRAGASRALANLPGPQLVMFSDPSDLLTFVSTPKSEQVPFYPLVNVLVSNDNTLLGFLERPDKAHEAYTGNKQVLRLMACGNPSRNCPE